MGFNNFVARRSFENKWKKLRKEYAEAGMSPEAIEEMYQFDLSVYRSDRRYYEHVLTDCFEELDGDIDCAEESNVLREKFLEAITIMPQETDSDRRDSWIDELDSPHLVEAVQKMSSRDIELLTLYAIEGYGVGEIAAMQGVSQPAISKKLKRIRNYLKKV